MERQKLFDRKMCFVHLESKGKVYSPRVDSYYERQHNILCYDIELPGVRQEDLKVVLGYSAITRQKSLWVWGMSLSPLWLEDLRSQANPNLPPLMASSNSNIGELLQLRLVSAGSMTLIPAIGPIRHPMQRTMERIHGEFYRLLSVPVQTREADIVLNLVNGILSIAIQCKPPLTPNELLVTQEELDVK
ncbi:hypothetical protein C8R41DRAFT_863119 [Lentinula lateritia]|uniref:SHSP domain-containing protein n=1 Tax=Lentinula lateritia TaxID=40482 RepID=A0ABQ8VWZ5_9AGAR|nr:hypothetical protein C8R41DRAFT_863119 [Lentinula lateritia]